MNGNISQTENKKIDLENVRPGMVTAKEVVSQSGTVLLAKNVLISQATLKKLFESDVKEIVVKRVNINIDKLAQKKGMQDFNEGPAKPVVPVSVAERPDFREFEQEYDKKFEVAKDTLKAISDGAQIDLDELTEFTDGIINKLKCKSDILTFIGFLKSYDEYTFSHSSNVALLCNLFASWLRLSDEETTYLTAAGFLHDIGKLKIPHSILNKQTRLTDKEYEIMKKHTILGYRILQTQNIPNEIKLGALMHHEKIDGTGYPLGVTHEKISKYARIIAICDIYDAMTSDRVYRGRICPFEVIKKFQISSYGELDTTYLLVFLKNIAYTYYGSWVKLNEGRSGEIVFINPTDLSRPMVRVGEEIIDLHEREELDIIGVI